MNTEAKLIGQCCNIADYWYYKDHNYQKWYMDHVGIKAVRNKDGWCQAQLDLVLAAAEALNE